VQSAVDEGIGNGKGFGDDEDARLVLNVEEPASVRVCESRLVGFRWKEGVEAVLKCLGPGPDSAYAQVILMY
jgi:hypothetical protein